MSPSDVAAVSFGTFTIKASVRVVIDNLISNIEVPGGDLAGGEQPAPPGGETDPGTGLPSEAPNMKYVLDKIYASQEWHLDTNNDVNGAGVFTEKAVAAMHDIDARWGFNRYGGTNFHGHSIDYAIWLSPDGKTAEAFDIIQGSPGLPQWSFKGRDTTAYNNWYYPA